MKAVVEMKGFGKALDLKFKSKLPAKEGVVLDKSDAGKKSQMEAKANNAIAMHYLTVLMDEEEHMGVINEVHTDK